MQAGSQLGALADERAQEEQKKAEAAEKVREINAAPGGASVIQQRTRAGVRPTINGEPVVQDDRQAAMTVGPMQYPANMSDDNTEWRIEPSKVHEYMGPLRQCYRVNGRVVCLPVAPEWDELAMGYAVEQVDGAAHSPMGRVLRRGFNEVIETLPFDLQVGARLENAIEGEPINDIPAADGPFLTPGQLFGAGEPVRNEWRNAPRYQ